MAQVSESTNSLQETLRSLQSQNPNQNEQAAQDRELTSQSNSQNQARQTTDRVVISREAQTENSLSNNIQETNTQRNRSESREASEVRDLAKNEASRNKNAEVQLREFQNQDKTELKVGPKQVSQSVDEIKVQRARAQKAREVVFEAPSQKIIQEVEPGQSEQARSQDKIVVSVRTTSEAQPASPASVQTGTGQNIDDVI